MKHLYITITLLFFYLSGFSQIIYTCRNYNYNPKIDATSDGIWTEWERTIETDSVQSGAPYAVYFNIAGLPDFGDLKPFDLEEKMKALWYKDSIYFLFQRMDDTNVNGLNTEGNPDETVAEGLDNLDATKIYFYLSSDSSWNKDGTIYDSLITWMQFVWKSDKVSAKLSTGEIVNNYEQFHTNSIQWCDGLYCYTKLGIDLSQIAPNNVMDTVRIKLDNYGKAGIGFFVETFDNDKEVKNENELYIMQTRAFWASLIEGEIESNVDKWHWLSFAHDTSNYYVSPVYRVHESFASVFPIPAYDYITINLKDFDEINYSVFDIMGRNILSGTFTDSRYTLPLDQLNTGTYFIQMKNKDNKFMAVKFLKLSH